MTLRVAAAAAVPVVAAAVPVVAAAVPVVAAAERVARWTCRGAEELRGGRAAAVPVVVVS